MGTQQLLLIVLGVIIVGIAIAVGISIFNNQSYNSNQQAVASECQNYGTQVVQWWKTPTAQGGAGEDSDNLVADDIALFIGFLDANGDGQPEEYVTTTGTYTIGSTFTDDTVTITGIGKEEKGGYNPKVTTTIDLTTGEIVSEVDKVAVPTGPTR